MKLSIVIPFFNQEEFIEKCLDSILSQKYKDYEVVLINDHSTDASPDKVKKYIAKHENIKMFNNIGRGAGAARNYGLQLSKGQLIHFHDADDWIEPTIYSDLVDDLLKSDADYVTFCYNKFDNKTGNLFKTNLFPVGKDKKFIFSKNDWEHILLKTSVVPWNKIYKKDFIKNIKFDELHVCNDRAFYFRALSNANKIQVCSGCYINYRVNNPNSLIGDNRGNYFSDIIKASRNVDDIYNSSSVKNKKIVINTNIDDVISFYLKCNKQQRSENFELISNYLSGIDVSIFEDDLENKKWFATYFAITNAKKNKKIERKEIPIVFATNDNYFYYMDVAIRSLLDNFKSAEKYKLNIYVLHSGVNRELIENMTLDDQDYSINFINVNGLVAEQMSYVRAHYSKEMYYRLLIPEIFSFHEKVIYLDCDIVVNADISNLFEIELDESPIAGVVNFCNDGMKDWIENGLKINSKKYINSGVLLIDVENFLKNKIKKKCFDFSNKRNFLACPDQDMLNFACRDNIKLIDSGWNLQWHHFFKKYKKSDTNKEWMPYLLNSLEKKYIFHFTSGIKPWSHPIYEGADIFWKYANKSMFYEDILFKNLKNKIEKLSEQIG